MRKPEIVLGIVGAMFLAVGATAVTGGRAISIQGTFLQSGTSASLRTIESKLRDQVSVCDFESPCPNGTDDTVAINAGIAAVAGGNGALYFPKGTYKVSSQILIASNQVELLGAGPSQTTIQYTGGATAAAFKVSSPTPSTVALQGIRWEGMTLKGNASTTDVLLVAGVFRSTFSDLNLRDATGCGLRTQWAVVDTWKRIHVSSLDFQGAFSTQPTNGLCFDQIDASHGTTASTVIDPVVEGVSGSGIKLTGAFNMVFTGGTSESNGRGIEFATGSYNVVIGMDMESNSTEDMLIGTDHNVFSAVLTSSTVGVHVTGNSNVFQGGRHSTLQIDSGAKGNEFDVSYVSAPVTDNGTDTKFPRLYNSTLGRLDQAMFFSRDTVPAIAYSGIGTPDKQDTLTGNYRFTSTASVISNTALTAGTKWRVLFAGVWNNNQEGGGLAQPADFIEATTAAATFAIGSVTMTVSLSGSNQVQVATGNAAHVVGFTGRIYVLSNPLGAAGTDAMLLKGAVTAGGLKAVGGALTPSTDGLAAQANGIFMGSGVPSNANGNNGDFYFRTDTPGTANQRLYIKSVGAWVALTL